MKHLFLILVLVFLSTAQYLQVNNSGSNTYIDLSITPVIKFDNLGKTIADSFNVSDIRFIVFSETEGPPVSVTLTSGTVSESQFVTEPNPFNPELRMRFTLKAPSRIRIRIYDPQGHYVRHIDKNYDRGVHSLFWTPKNKPSGTYIIRAELGSQIITRKIVLLK